MIRKGKKKKKNNNNNNNNSRSTKKIVRYQKQMRDRHLHIIRNNEIKHENTMLKSGNNEAMMVKRRRFDGEKSK
jgi:hypothetical protein